MNGSEGRGLKSGSSHSLFFSFSQKFFWRASGTVCDGTLRTKFLVTVPVLKTQPNNNGHQTLFLVRLKGVDYKSCIALDTIYSTSKPSRGLRVSFHLIKYELLHDDTVLTIL